MGAYRYIQIIFNGTKYVIATSPAVYIAYSLGLLSPYYLTIYGVTIVAQALL